jgi:hypothetical protein
LVPVPVDSEPWDLIGREKLIVRAVVPVVMTSRKTGYIPAIPPVADSVQLAPGMTVKDFPNEKSSIPVGEGLSAKIEEDRSVIR